MLARLWPRWLVAVAVVAAALATVVGPNGVGGPRRAEAQTPSLAVGVALDNGDAQAADLDSFASLVGRKPTIVQWYQAWSEPIFYSSQMTAVSQRGELPLITWDPATASGNIPLTDITSGKWDSYLDQQAAAVAGTGQTVFIRFAHEMNLDGYNPAQFIAAWRYVVNRFRADGATNARWVWAPNVDCTGSCPFTAEYPGDAWVDVLGLDGYNYAQVDGVPWMSLDQVFGSSYNEITALSSKPLWITEASSVEDPNNANAKAQWITQGLGTDVPTKMPRVSAVVWFDRVKEADWTVNSSAASLAAYVSQINSSQYSANAADVLSSTNPANKAPAITSASSGSATAGTASSFTVSASGLPTPSLSESGNMDGLSFADNHNGTAAISGTPVAAGTYTFAITATNGVGNNATQTFTLTVSAAKQSLPSPPTVVGARASNGALWVKTSGASGFSSLGGSIIAAPAIAAVPVSGGPPAPLYVVTGSDHSVYVRTATSAWQHLTTAFAYCIDNPAAVVTGGAGSSTLTVTCQGGNHALYVAQGPVAPGVVPTLGSWSSLGGVLAAGPAVAAVNGTLTYFVEGTDDHVWVRTATVGWTQYSWICLSHPAVATAGSTTTFACHGTDNTLRFATNSGTGWGGGATNSAGGVVVDGPAVAATSTGATFFIEGTDGAVWQTSLTGGVQGSWSSDGGSGFTNGMGAAGLG